MPREYTKTGDDLGDYIVGNSTGAGYNFWSELGASHQVPQVPPVSIVPPQSDPIAPMLSGVNHHEPLAYSRNKQPFTIIPQRQPILRYSIWGLPKILTDRFDVALNRIKGTKAWISIIITSTLLSGFSGFVMSQGSYPEWVSMTIFGLAIGSAAPFLLEIACRWVLWLVGAAIEILFVTGIAVGVAFIVQLISRLFA